MMTRYLLATATVLLLAVGNAHAAAEWRVISKGGGTELWIDYSRPFGTGEIRKAWTAFIYAEPQAQVPNVTTGPYRSSIGLAFANCETRKLASQYAVFYAKSNLQGATVGTWGTTEEPLGFFFSETVPGSYGETMVDQICAGYSPPKPTTQAWDPSVAPKRRYDGYLCKEKDFQPPITPGCD